MRARAGAIGWALCCALLSSVTLVTASTTLAPRARAAPNHPAPNPRPVGPVRVGQDAPSLNLSRISGSDAITNNGLNGQVVVLDFWATWCGPCRALMPVLDRLYQRHHSRGLAVVGLSPESEIAIRRHLSMAPVSYTIARDAGGTTSRYGVRAIPTLFVLDRTGKVRSVMRGLSPARLAELDRTVERLLAEPAP